MLNRRTFLASLAAATPTAPLARAQAGRAKPKRKIRVGALNVARTFWGVWAEILSPRGRFGTPLLNMEITYCWDIDPKGATEFAEKYDCQAVSQYDGMLGKVDAIIFAGLYEVRWQHLLARPYLEAGVPTYLSRPFSYRLRDLDDTLNLAAKHSTPLIASSVHEHYYEASYLKGRLKNLGPIRSVYGVCNSDEYPGHFHVQWFILRALGYDVEKVSLFTDNEWQASYLQETMLFKGQNDQPPFLASLHAGTNTPYLGAEGYGIPPLYVEVIGDQGRESIHVDRSPNSGENLYYYFAGQLVDMQRTFEGHNFQPFDFILKKTQIFLAGYYSHLEKGGSLIPVGSLPMDWSPPHYKPDWIENSIDKKWAELASRIAR